MEDEHEHTDVHDHKHSHGNYAVHVSSKAEESWSRKTHAAGWRRTAEAGQEVEIGPVSASRTAAAFLRSGTQHIQASARNRPGTYEMINSLFVPSGVTVRGTPGKTILRKSAGVESPLAEDGDYGESVLMAVHPENLRPGMGITISDDAQTLAGMSALRPSPLWKDECSASGR